MVSHPYNIYDNLIGDPIIKLVKESGGIPIYVDACDSNQCILPSIDKVLRGFEITIFHLSWRKQKDKGICTQYKCKTCICKKKAYNKNKEKIRRGVNMLYHASGEIVIYPEIRISKYPKDFFVGFLLYKRL